MFSSHLQESVEVKASIVQARLRKKIHHDWCSSSTGSRQQHKTSSLQQNEALWCWTVSVPVAVHWSKWQWKDSEGAEQTYLSSGVWAAMRDRRLLSARGHPDRLRERRKSEAKAEEERKETGGEESKCEGDWKERGERHEWREIKNARHTKVI